MSMSATKIEFRWSLFVWLACLATVLCLNSCMSPNVHAPITTCQGIDWYEIGRRDGATGTGLTTLADYQKQCRKDKNHPDAELYTNGRNAGLVEYCTPQMGLEAARFGRSYAGVCPSHLEKPFMRGFQAGQKIRTLDSDNTSIDVQIQTLSRSIAAIDGGADTSATANVTGGTAVTRNPASATESNDARTKLSSLRKKHVSNDDAIAALEKSISTSTKN